MSDGASADRRSELLDVAATVFETAGIRASVADIARASGIKGGSLYHHFESKEAIILELVERYLADLEEVAARTLSNAEVDGGVSIGTIVNFGQTIADRAVRHRAALLLTLHEPPTVYGAALPGLAAQIPRAITQTMRELLTRAAATGGLRRTVRVDTFADRLCQNMLHVGVGVFHRSPEAHAVPALRCLMLLEGLAPGRRSVADLGRSDARKTADAVIAAWPPRHESTDDRESLVMSAAREEFGRRGYEATTVRDIAAAAGVSTKAVYRIAPSKEDLLWRILGWYADHLVDARDAVLDADASPLEKLDAMLWLNINTIDRFHAETNIVSSFFQVLPPTSPDLEVAAKPEEVVVPFAQQLHGIEKLLDEGQRSGELTLADASVEVLARCVFALIWTPHNIVQELGLDGALRFGRDTLIRGASTRRIS